MPLSANDSSRSLKWLSRLGWVLIVLGVLFFTPAADLLPIEMLSFLQSGSTQSYYRVVPVYGEPFFIQPEFAMVGACLVFFGVAFIVVTRQRRTP